MIAAVVSSSGVVTARIVAEAGVDSPPPGYTLANIPDGLFVDMGYTYDDVNGFQPPIAVDPVVEPTVEPVQP